MEFLINMDEIHSSDALTITDSNESCGSTSSNKSSPNFIQQNGRKVYGPPNDWVGPAPHNDCELFIKKIPKNINEDHLFQCFFKFGKIYQFRLLMEYDNTNRGFAYVRYTNSRDAQAAMAVLNHYYINPGKKMEIEKSYEKSRFFVGNIPKNVSNIDIETTLRNMFPEMLQCIVHRPINLENKNRGFAFIDFPNHKSAVEAKKTVATGRSILWGHDVRIVWAIPVKHNSGKIVHEGTSLFVRNVDLTINKQALLNIISDRINKSTIKKTSRFREYAFIEFCSRESASVALHSLQGITINGKTLKFEWAMPPNSNSLHCLKNKDFDSILRIKCIANNWRLPIYIFGRCFDEYSKQYVAIITGKKDKPCAFFLDVSTEKLIDIQSRIAEVIITIIEIHGDLPNHNYVLKVENDTVHLIGSIIELSISPIFLPAVDITVDIIVCLAEFSDLCMAVLYLTKFSFDDIYKNYCAQLHKLRNGTYLNDMYFNDKLFGCVSPNYRNKPNLQHNLDNRQIILVLCDKYSNNNYNIYRPLILTNLKFDFQQKMHQHINNSLIKYSYFTLCPSHFVQQQTNFNELNFKSIAFNIRN